MSGTRASGRYGHGPRLSGGTHRVRLFVVQEKPFVPAHRATNEYPSTRCRTTSSSSSCKSTNTGKTCRKFKTGRGAAPNACAYPATHETLDIAKIEGTRIMEPHATQPKAPYVAEEKQSRLSNLGVIVSVRGSVVDIRFDAHLPPIYSVLLAGPEKQIVIEVLAQQDAHHVRGIALTPTQGLARGTAVEDTGGPLKAPVGKAVLSRMFDVFGNTIDREAALSDVQWRSVHQAPPSLARRSTKSEVFETGIKVIDVLVLLTEMIHNMIGHHEGVSIFCGIGERCREGEELYDAMKEAGVLPNMVMVFGQMNEPPGARFRVGHAALTMAEYFRDDEHRDVLLLVDNIFRFIQAGMEVSGLMGQMPSRLGYQPTMGTELSGLEERI